MVAAVFCLGLSQSRVLFGGLQLHQHRAPSDRLARREAHALDELGRRRGQGDKTVAEQRPVVTGVRQGGFVELKDGVAAGDRIVGDGLNKIQPNQAVKPVGAGRPQGVGGAARRPAP